MIIAESTFEFERYATARLVELRAPSSVRLLAETWLSFFEAVRVTDATTEEGSWPDALLFEFGYRKALAGYYGSCFYLNLTRQFISQQGEDDDAMFQLVWRAEYEPIPQLCTLGHRSEWCDSLQSLAYFRNEVLSSPVLACMEALRATKFDYFFTGL